MVFQEASLDVNPKASNSSAFCSQETLSRAISSQVIEGSIFVLFMTIHDAELAMQFPPMRKLTWSGLASSIPSSQNAAMLLFLRSTATRLAVTWTHVGEC